MVTGGTGFIGRYLVKTLVQHDWDVLLLVRVKGAGNTQNGPQVNYHVGDLTRPETLNGIVNHVDVIFHLAAQLGEWGVPCDSYYKLNVNGTRCLLDLCCDQKIKRFVHISTPGVQGKGHRRANEDMPYNPPYLYEQTKCMAEQLVLGYHRDFKLPVTIIRPDFVYGPGDYRRVPLYRAIQKHLFLIVGDGSSVLHPTYVADTVEGLLLSATNPCTVGEIVNIAGPHIVSIKEYVTTIARALKVKPPPFNLPQVIGKEAAFACELISKFTHRAPFVSRSKIEFLTRDHGSDISKARRLIGFSPNYPLERGFQLTLDWMTRNALI